MKRFFILPVLILLCALLLCACGGEKGEQPSEAFEAPSETEGVFEEEPKPEETVPKKEPKEYYLEYYDFEFPDFQNADRTRLPLIGEEKWCVNESARSEQSDRQQLFAGDETAKELAYAISLVDSFFFREYDFNGFESVSEANCQYLLYASVVSTPTVLFDCTYTYADGKPTAETSQPDNIVSKLCAYAHENYDLAPTEVIYAGDVEKTFHYLFGSDAEFVPETVYNRCYRYVPGEDIYLYFLETSAPAKDAYPQIISYSSENGIYTVEAAMLSVFDYDGEGNVNPELTEEYILSLPRQEYVFERAEDGHFVLKSIAK